MEEEIYQASLIKRIISSLLDFIITILLSIGFFMLLSNGAIDIGFHNLDYKIKQYQLEEQSFLFDVKKNANGSYQEIAPLSYDLTNKEEYKNILKRINDYYFSFTLETNKSNSTFNKKYLNFNEETLKNSIFSINSIDDSYTEYTLLDEIKDVSNDSIVNKSDEKNYLKAINNFFMDKNKGIYNFALTEFTSGERFQSLVNQLETIERIEIMICVFVSTLIFVSLPVLLNKNGETAFMHVLSICFVDSYGYRVKWKNKIIRSILVILINVISAYLFLIPLVINSLVMLFNSSKRSLIDIASNETAVDKKTSIILD